MTNSSLPISAGKSVDKGLSTISKMIYGSGDWGRASYNTLRQFFYAIFLTDVVGIAPMLASIAALVSIIWDAINDPLVGALSDNVRTRWGRRRPFLLIFSIPFSLAFILLWWAPPWQSQIMLTIHVTLAFVVADTIQTLITVPYLALTPELASGYDERTSLTSFRMFFNLLASLVTAVSAPSIMDFMVNNGYSLQQSYLTIAALFGGLAIIPFFLIFFNFKEREVIEPANLVTPTFKDTLRILWQNRPFRFATGIYVMNWIAFDLVGLMLPYFLLYWIAQGNLLAKVDIFGANIALESVVFGVLLITATVTIPLWNWIAIRFSKKTAYISGMLFWIVVQLLIFNVQPEQMGLITFLAFLAGISVSTAHIMPEAIFPDVIDWDELRTHHRREGMYYGAINFIRKMSSAIAIFLALQVLGWFGYQPPPETADVFMQTDSAIFAIRFLTGPVAAVLLVLAITAAWFYPLNRDRQIRIRRSLTRRNKINAERLKKNNREENKS